MIRKLRLIIILFAIPLFGLAQPYGFTPDHGASKTYHQGGIDIVYEGTPGYAGDFWYAGQTTSYGDISGDAYLINFNPSTNDTLWAKAFGTPNEDCANSVAFLNDPVKAMGNEVFIAGYTSNGTDRDLYVNCISENGYQSWDTILDFGVGDDEFNDIYTDDSWSGVCYASGYVTTAGGKDAYIAKIDKWTEGITFTFTSGGSADDVLNAFAINNMQSYIGVGAGYSESFSAGTDKDIYLSVIDVMTGMFLFDTAYVAANDQVANDIFYDYMDDSYFIVGYSVNASGNKDVYIMKLDSGFNIVWEKTYDISGMDDEILDLEVFSIEGAHFYTTGYTTNPNTSDKDVYYLEFDWNGDIANSAIYGGSGTDIGYSILYDCDVFIAGTTNSLGNEEIYTLKRPYLDWSVTSSDITCFASNDGFAEIVVTGGSGNYYYTWMTMIGPYSYNQSNYSIPAGVYSIEFQDDIIGSCLIIDTVIITEPMEIMGSIIPQGITCEGVCDGSALANISGGIIPYSLYWSDGQTTDAAYNLCDGIVGLDVYDANGCYMYYETSINATFGPLADIIDITHNDCYGDCLGQATIVPFQAMPPLTIEWSTGSSDSTVTGLCGGMHTVSVTDPYGCSSFEVYIEQPEEYLINFVSTDIICFGDSAGAISATVSGGTPPYTTLWNDGAATQSLSISNQPAGWYSLQISDSMNCLIVDNIEITQPAQLVSTISSSTNVSCFGDDDGNASSDVTGGISPYVYGWGPISGNQTGPTAVGLTAGTYTLTVTDQNACTSTVDAVITQPDSLIVTFAITDVLCNGEQNGEVQATVTGGTSPYNTQWSNGASTLNIVSLSAGDHYLYINDPNGCSATEIATVSEPALISVALTSTSATCGAADGSADISSATGGSGVYTYLWSDGQTTATATNVTAGDHSITITDSNGCTGEAVVFVSSQGGGIVTVTDGQIMCFGQTGSASASMSDGTAPFNYNWSDGQTSSTAVNLSEGIYYVTVTDVNGCIGTSTVTINPEPAQLYFYITSGNASCTGCDGTAEAVVSGGTPPYQYLWSTGDTVSNNNTLCGDSPYYISVTDANNCWMSSGTYINGSTMPQLSGYVYYTNEVFDAGDVSIELYKEVTNSDIQLEYYTETLNLAGGSFQFTDIWPDTYFMRVVVNDEAGHPDLINTYYANTFSWYASTPINLSCSSSPNLSVNMYEVMPLMGSGSITGTITYQSDNKATGDPVPGAEVYIEQEPSDDPIANVETDTSGIYIFDNIPFGEGYNLVVDIPGFPLLSTHSDITVASDDPVVEDMNFFVDSSDTGGIYIDSLSSVAEFASADFNLKLYPNPFVDVINFEYTLNSTGNVSIEIFDAVGRKLSTLVDKKQASGYYNMQYDPAETAQGVYYIKFSIDNNYYFKKLVRAE